jgi:hypothetical protein
VSRLLLGAVFALVMPLAGCAHHAYHQAKADYEHDRAHEDLHTGHPVGAIKHKIKEGHEQHKADRDALYE